MQALSKLLVLLSISSLAFAAPTRPTLEPAKMFANGLKAQRLNIISRDIKVTDSCTTGDSICIGTAVHNCVNGSWKSSFQCTTPDVCLAVPSVFDEDTTILGCQSEANALKVFAFTGNTGGLFGDAVNSTSTSAPASGATSVAPTTITVAPPATVTVTVTPSLFTQATITVTVSPEEASRILSSIAATASPASSIAASGSGSSFITLATSRPTAFSQGVPASSVVVSGSGSSAAPTRIITLIPVLETVVPTQISASASSTAAAVSSAAVAEPNSEYGEY